MPVPADLKMYARFAWGLRSFLRETITLEDARAIISERLEQRESNFLRVVERGVYGYPRSPYLPLLELAQVELGDIQNMVRDRGLEGTLRSLREAGVYVTFEEFKGRAPMVRDGKTMPVQASSFDNPYHSRHYQTQSGGTSGAGTRVTHDLDQLAAQAPLIMLGRHAHGVVDVPHALWHAILPGTGINNILRSARFGNVPDKWFSPITSEDIRPALRYRLATRYIVRMGRLFGVPLPWPQAVTLEHASVVARWAAHAAASHGTCLVSTTASMAVRVALAAQDEGLDLAGVVFSGGGEPPTLAKVKVITSTGARCAPGYFFAEAGVVGQSCAHPIDENDIHFFKDVLALIQYPTKVPGSDMVVDAFHFTSLLPTAPKLLLNVESDDYGVIEERRCGCPLEAYDYTEHLRHIRSFRKLKGEGVTLVGSEMVRILQDVLPARYGGSPLDYQLLEEEGMNGFTRLTLLVSPKIEIHDEQQVIETVLEALGQGSVSADLARAMWRKAGTLRVKRSEPIWTARGKLMPLHMVQRTSAAGDAPADSTRSQ